jgi:hypothetical protein
MSSRIPPADEERIAAAVTAWCELDRARAAWPGDREVIEATASLRALVVERARARATDPADDELFDACAILGRRIAWGHGSVTLAAWTADHAGEALGAGGAEWVRPAGAAVVEGYVAEVLDAARAEALSSWEFPHCVVSLAAASVAIAAGYPSSDPEAIAEWAARVARAAAVRGVRKAFVTGAHAATVAEALLLTGIETVTSPR